MSGWRLGIDIGGTFTDIALLGDDGRLVSKKVLSSPDDYSRAIEAGVVALLAESAIAAADIDEVAHGTTVATNAIIERQGVTVALITTAGFRDVLEIARFRSPRLYDVSFRKPDALVERRLRFEVAERIGADGTIVQPLDEAGVRDLARRLAGAGVKAIAVCFINAYVDGRHEARAAEILRSELPGVPVTVSSELVPQIQEYERTSTTVVNAYIRPVIEGYARRLSERLAGLGIPAPLNIMQSNGGVLPAALAAEKPIFVIESGPAAGVVGARRLAERHAIADAIVFDMGGTTAKATLIVDGAFALAPETEVGGEAALGHRMVRGGGYVVQAPTIDIAEVGAGGGSIAWIDPGGGLQIGPRSAGADPGPACYGRGGTAATVTDANLLLGLLNPDALVGGDLALDPEAAARAIGEVAAAIGHDATGAAHGIHQIANARMMRALGAVSSERGLDPARFPLIAFGGNGGVHVTGLAEALGAIDVMVPPAAGIFSALGLLFADVEHQCIRAFWQPLGEGAAVAAEVAALRREAEALVAEDGYTPAARAFEATAEIKYVSQNAPLALPLPEGAIDDAALARLAEEFAQAHEAIFGYRSDGEEVQFVTLKVVGRGLSDRPRLPPSIQLDAAPRAAADRRVYFGPETDWIETAILGRGALDDRARPGPLVVEEYDSTTVVPPDWTARLDAWNNILLARKG